MHPEVSIIILNYNTPELTTACVQSVIAHTHDISYEIVLIDNASKSESKIYFDTHLSNIPELHIHYSTTNRGFGGGNNLGYNHSKGEYLFFLNSDTIIYENSIKILADEYKKHEEQVKTGFLAPRLYYDPAKTTKQIFGTKVPTFWDVMVYNIPKLKKIWKKKYDRFRYADRDRETDKEIGNA